jgi:His-Xaa-Ser system protein HxsD
VTPEAADAVVVEVAFAKETTELDALQRAAYAVADVMTVNITAAGDQYVCTLYTRDPGADPGMLAHRIRAEVIDQALRLRIAAQTEPLRNLIFALAFSQTGLAEAEESPS